MDLDARARIIDLRARVVDTNQPPANVVWESRKIRQAENHVKNIFKKCFRAPA